MLHLEGCIKNWSDSVLHRSAYPLASTLTHTWVSTDWLPGLGLPQFSSTFEAHFIDGRLLNVLTKKDLEKHLSVLEKLHQTSILCGIELLRSLEFDKRASPLSLSVALSACVFISLCVLTFDP